MPIKILSLNIEGDNHYDKIFPFFEKEQPDVVCLHEFFAQDISLFEEKLGMYGVSAPIATVTQENPYRLASKGPWGSAILSKHQFSTSTSYYKGDPAILPELVIGDPNSVNRAVLFADVEKEGQTYHLATTHFTWADGGGTNESQAQDLPNMLALFENTKEIVFCGDFNAPRGAEVFSKIATAFVDNIPSDVMTTMDNALHRVGHLLRPLVVDGLFTRGYTARNVRVVSGVSDHCAIVGEIT